MCEPTTMVAIGTYLGASSSAALATGLAATSLATTAVAGGISAYSAHQQGQVAKQVGRNNQIMAEYAAEDAQRRGEEQAIQARRKGDQIKGAARANMAAKGLDLSVGTAAELQDQTDFFSESDQNMARFNAQRDAWSARVAGANAAAQGRAAAQQGNLQAFGTLLATGGQVASKWGDYTAAKTPPKKGP